MSRPSRQRAERAGRRAEWLAALAYGVRGYRVLARRFRTSGGEIDIIAQRGGVLAFIEVKARRDHDAAIFSVTPAARRRIEQAARSFLARHPHLASLDVRYDIAAVSGLRVAMVRDAWRAHAKT